MTIKSRSENAFEKYSAMKQKNPLGNSPDILISKNPDICWIWDIPTLSLWLAITLSGKIQIIKIVGLLKRKFQGLQNKTNRDFLSFLV